MVFFFCLTLSTVFQTQGNIYFYTGWNDKCVKYYINDQLIFQRNLVYIQPDINKIQMKVSQPILNLEISSFSVEKKLYANIKLKNDRGGKKSKKNILIADENGLIRMKIVLKNKVWEKSFSVEDGLFFFVEKKNGEVEYLQLKEKPMFE